MSDDLADKIRRGEEISSEDLRTVFKTADQAGVLYYKMLTMVRDQRSLTELPETLKKIIKTEAWKNWRWVGSTFSQNSIGAYLTSPPPNGVGIQMDTVWKLVADDPEALAMLREATTGEPGAHHDNVMMREAKQGNTRAYTLDRLKREKSDLFDRVVAGELSANAAAIEAGWRKRPVALEVIVRLLPKLTPEELDQVIEKITEIRDRLGTDRDRSVPNKT